MASYNHAISLSDTLDLFVDTYNYNHWIYNLLRPFIGNCILEAGCGIGNVTQFLLKYNEVVCIDADKSHLKSLKDYVKNHNNLTLLHKNIMDIPCKRIPDNYFDSVICVNVLEHIEDDFEAIVKMGSIMKPGGRLILYVPACNWAYGKLDELLGHYRRYSRPRLQKLARNSNMKIKCCHFVNLPGVFGWFWSARIKKDSTISRQKVKLVDKVVPYLSVLESFIKPPIGQSLFAVMVK